MTHQVLSMSQGPCDIHAWPPRELMSDTVHVGPASPMTDTSATDTTDTAMTDTELFRRGGSVWRDDAKGAKTPVRVTNAVPAELGSSTT
jgi:hypothetical protein